MPGMLGPESRRRRRLIHREEYESYTSPGDVVTSDTDCLRGHGTFVRRGQVVASISGIVEWMDKLVTVRPLGTRYVAATAAIGDIVVGRVTEVVLGRGQRWKLDIQSQQDAHLLLSAINIDGSARERRWTEEHADLEMRSYFTEDDLVVAEVQKIYEDGALHLHTKSKKYGKLTEGQLLAVPPTLVKRQKQHFHTLRCGGCNARVILATNGLIWIAPDRSSLSAGDSSGASRSGEADTDSPCTPAERQAICRVHNAIKALVAVFVLITPASIEATVDTALSMGLDAAAMLAGSSAQTLQLTAAARGVSSAPSLGRAFVAEE
jgi:exosome complex component RRP4